MVTRRVSKKPEHQRRIALERIKLLFKQADETFQKDKSRSKRYIQLARKIGMRYNIRIPRELKRRVCKYCYSYLKPGINSKIRANSRQRAVIVKCLECGKISRYPYRKAKK